MPTTGQCLTAPPVSGRALLKQLKDDIAQQAAMTALLCESAGWTLLASLFSMLAADAAAASRPELRELLQVLRAASPQQTLSSLPLLLRGEAVPGVACRWMAWTHAEPEPCITQVLEHRWQCSRQTALL